MNRAHTTRCSSEAAKPTQGYLERVACCAVSADSSAAIRSMVRAALVITSLTLRPDVSRIGAIARCTKWSERYLGGVLGIHWSHAMGPTAVWRLPWGGLGHASGAIASTILARPARTSCFGHCMYLPLQMMAFFTSRAMAPCQTHRRGCLAVRYTAGP
jgi:hypothetical protein